MTSTPASTQSPGSAGYPSFFSSTRGVHLPVGNSVEAGRVRGYFIDFSLKASDPSWPPSWLGRKKLVNHVVGAQWGLGCFERFLGGHGDRWLDAAVATARYFAAAQTTSGAWLHLEPMRHTFAVEAPWVSAMAQGELASLLVRVHLETGEERFAEAARRALRPMAIPVGSGGARAEFGDGFLLEEYPAEPPSHVLNGAIFALWGYHDVGVGLADRDALSEFERGVDSLAAGIDRWDTGSWSRYDLLDRRVVNVASPFYHRLHIDQIKAMQIVAPRPALGAAAERFSRYEESRLMRLVAFGRKAWFRMLVPRHPALSHRSPFTGATDRSGGQADSRV